MFLGFLKAYSPKNNANWRDFDERLLSLPPLPPQMFIQNEPFMLNLSRVGRNQPEPGVGVVLTCSCFENPTVLKANRLKLILVLLRNFNWFEVSHLKKHLKETKVDHSAYESNGEL